MTTPTPDTPPTPSEDDDITIVIVYDPPGQDPQSWEFDPGEWTVGEVKLIEKTFGKPRDDFFEDVNAGFDTYRIFLLWLVRRRTEPDLKLDDLDDMLSPHITFGQIVDDPKPAGIDDPEPDGVNDPQAGRHGANVETPDETQKQPVSCTA